MTLTVPGANSLIEKRFIFFPERELVGSPAELGLDYEEVHFLASDGVKLHGWFVPGDSDTTWIWFHGNAGNISHRLENLALLNQKLGVSILLFDYRGYGRSEGDISEKGTYLDATGALEYLRTRGDVDPNRIVYYGRSLGSAVAVWLATEHAPLGTILESPFSSVRDMAKAAYPGLPLYLLVRTRYDSLSLMPSVSSPILILHGDLDGTVPISQGRKLYEAAREPKRFYTITGAAHNDTYITGGEPYFEALQAFLDSLRRD